MLLLIDDNYNPDEQDFMDGCNAALEYLDKMGINIKCAMKNDYSEEVLNDENWIVAVINSGIIKNCLFLYYMEHLRNTYIRKGAVLTLLIPTDSKAPTGVFAWLKDMPHIHISGSRDAYSAAVMLVNEYFKHYKCSYDNIKCIASNNKKWFTRKPFLIKMINQILMTDEGDYRKKIIYLDAIMEYILCDLKLKKDMLTDEGYDLELIYKVSVFVFNYSGTLMPEFKEEVNLMEKCFLLAFEQVNLYN